MRKSYWVFIRSADKSEYTGRKKSWFLCTLCNTPYLVADTNIKRGQSNKCRKCSASDNGKSRRISIQKGDTFNELTAVQCAGSGPYHQSMWEWRCSCDNLCVKAASLVVNGRTKTCGKCHKVRVDKLDYSLYDVWQAIKGRCLNPLNRDYPRYGGRGISISDEWTKFKKFKEDMKPSYSKGLSIDRVDNDGDYCKDNCRWTTNTQQARNRSSNTPFKGYNTIVEYAEATGITTSKAYGIVYRLRGKVRSAPNN